MGTFSSGFSQVGSVTIVGNQNVCGASTWTYSITGTSCTTANWIVLGGTITSSNNISCTVQWNSNGGSDTVQVSAYSCSPTPENRTGFLSAAVTKAVQEIERDILGTNHVMYRGILTNATSGSWSFSGFTGLTILNQGVNSLGELFIEISYTSRNPNVTVCVSALPGGCGKTTGSSQTCAYNL